MKFETFAALDRLDFITHAFAQRCAEDTRADAYQDGVLEALGFPKTVFASAEQSHGNGVAVVAAPVSRASAVDALITTTLRLPLLIRCADCATVYLVDPVLQAIGLVHSGKAGTRANIVGCALASMRQHFGTNPSDCLAVISPSIGPCHYEVNIWNGIEQQLHDAGVVGIHNPRTCTACHLDRYFSYRAEKGATGRMIAVLALTPP
jgi:hypothetical protein